MTAWFLATLLAGVPAARAAAPADTGLADTGPADTGSADTGAVRTNTANTEPVTDTSACPDCDNASDLASEPGGSACRGGCTTSPAGGAGGALSLALFVTAGRTRRRP